LEMGDVMLSVVLRRANGTLEIARRGVALLLSFTLIRRFQAVVVRRSGSGTASARPSATMMHASSIEEIAHP